MNPPAVARRRKVVLGIEMQSGIAVLAMAGG
jgi:hypothetical protein